MRNIIETIGGEAYKRYRVYEKPLPASPGDAAAHEATLNDAALNHAT